jgi:DNA-binding transcriptional MerR regulator
MSELLTIGEVAAQAGLRTSALRYYEQTGLLRPATRVSGQRRYDAAALDRLAVIQFCRRLGFSLSEIRVLLTEPRGNRQKTRWRGLVDEKVGELDATLAAMRAMRKVLITSRDCDCVDVTACAKLCS